MPPRPAPCVLMMKLTWLSLFLLFLKHSCGSKIGVSNVKSMHMHNATKPRYHVTDPNALKCLMCHNIVGSDHCIVLGDVSEMKNRTCRQRGAQCMVRRFETKGELTTFDRMCSTNCVPGCRIGGYYKECISCCNHAHLCNTDNSAPRWDALATRVEMVSVAFLAWIVPSFVWWAG